MLITVWGRAGGRGARRGEFMFSTPQDARDLELSSGQMFQLACLSPIKYL